MSRAYAKENPRVKNTRCKMNPLRLFLAFFFSNLSNVMHNVCFTQGFFPLSWFFRFVFVSSLLQCRLSLFSKEASQHALLLIVTQLVGRENMLRALLSSLLNIDFNYLLKSLRIKTPCC